MARHRSSLCICPRPYGAMAMALLLTAVSRPAAAHNDAASSQPSTGAGASEAAPVSGRGSEVLTDDEPLSDEEVLTDDEPLSDEEVLTDDEPLSDEEVLTDDEPLSDEEVLTDDEPLSDEEVLTDDEPLSDEEVLTDDEPFVSDYESPEQRTAKARIRGGAILLGVGTALVSGALGLGLSDPCARRAGNSCSEPSRNRAAVTMGIPGALMMAGGATLLGLGLRARARLKTTVAWSPEHVGFVVSGRF